jgi:SWI/SNF-related matrix-associated actin-dependent regulator of chromatin subfamily A-like protein 1
MTVQQATAAVSRAEAPFAPFKRRSEWFTIPRSWAPEIAPAPKIQLDQGHLIAHLTHLPILAAQHHEVRAYLDARSSSELERVRAHAAFDAVTAQNGWSLRSYQHEGRDYIRARRGTLLADTMRLGKTCTSVASHDPESGPLLVVAPLVTREVWISWMRKRWPDKKPVILMGKAPGRAKKTKSRNIQRDDAIVLQADKFDPSVIADADLIFCNYDIIAGWRDFGGRRIGTMVLDEAHLLSNKKTHRTESAFILTTACERVIAATGTPLWNRPKGLWALLSILNPGAWGKWFEFAERYCDGKPGAHGYEAEGVSNEDEFKIRLRELMIRRTWQDVLTDLPAMERSIETIDISEKQAFEVEKEAERVRDASKRRIPAGDLARFRRLLARLKIQGAIDAAQRVMSEGERVVVWAWHNDIAFKLDEAFSKAGHPSFVVTGRTDPETREEIFNRWRATPAAPLVITMAVGQVGIDLSAARHAVFAELDFTPAIVAQAEMRVFSALRPSAITYMIIDHAVERSLLTSLQSKCEMSQRMGTPAAETAIDTLSLAFGVSDSGDLDRLAGAIFSDHDGAFDNDDHSSNWYHDAEEAS